MDICEYSCDDKDCSYCYLVNPCLNCNDYDYKNKKCTSNGGCANPKVQSIGQEGEIMDKDEKAMDLTDKIIEMVSSMEDDLLLAFLYTITHEMVDRKIFERKKVGD